MDLLRPHPISGRTKLVGVMGWPVSHSLSPAMHNAAFAAAGIDAAYVPLACAPELIADAVRGLRALGFVGANVTIPHKVSVAGFMDELTPAAKAIGAVNTIRVEADGRLTGHNTDCFGAVRAVEEDGTPLRGKTVAVLGTGGAGRGVAVGCALAGARRVLLLNRTVEKAEELLRELQAQPDLPSAVEWEAHPGEAGFRKGAIDWETVDCVMQMTSVGMHHQKGLPMDVSLLSPRCHVLEAVYAPLETEFLREARAKGLRATDGLGMLMEQGAAAFEFWFGISPGREVMRAALHAAVAQKH